MSVTKGFFTPTVNSSATSAKSMDTRSTQKNSELPLRESLGFRFALLFLLLWALLGAGVWYATHQLFENPLYADLDTQQRNMAQAVANQALRLIEAHENTATALSVYAGSQKFASAGLRQAALALVQQASGADRIAAFGIWPESPSSPDKTPLYWVRDPSGNFQPREDADEIKSSYLHELWYQSARFTPENRCVWQLSGIEPISKRRVVTCTVPVKIGSTLLGAITVSVDVQKFGDALNRATNNQPGYGLLIDRDGRSLVPFGEARTILSEALPSGTVIDVLGTKLSAYAPLVTLIKKRVQDIYDAGLHAHPYDPKIISQLQDGAKGVPRKDAEGVLLWLWGQNEVPTDVALLSLDHDPGIDQPSALTINGPIGNVGWILIRGSSSEHGLAGARFLTQQTLIIALVLLSLGLLASYLLIRRTMLNPLGRMAKRLILSNMDGDLLGVALDTSAVGEIGFIAHWQNERVQQLRDLNERSLKTQNQLIHEASERTHLQESLALTQELNRALLEAVEHGVIICDINGIVKEVNPVAERLLGILSESAQGKPLGEIFVAQAEDEGGQILISEPVIQAIERGTPYEMSDGVLLRGPGGLQEIRLSLVPLIGRNAKLEGGLLNFSRTMLEEGSGDAAALIETDPHTGFGRRTACERRVRSLLDTPRTARSAATLAILDLESLSTLLRKTAGTETAEEILHVLTDQFAAQVDTPEKVFRLPSDLFAFTLEDMDLSTATEWATALLSTLAEVSFNIEDVTVVMHGGVGLCPIESSNGAATDIVRRATRAAHLAKQSAQNGGSAVLRFELSMDRDTVKTDDLWLSRVRRGIDENLFHLSTQWIATSQDLSEEGSAYELLLALEDEEGFWSPPGAFLPVVERHKMTSEVDQWVVSRVLEHLERNPELLSGLAFASINLSAGTIADSGFVNFLVAALARHPQIAPGKLCFDLPIGAATDAVTDTPAFCEMIRLVGARTCLSLGSLRQSGELESIRKLPIDIMSIDAAQFPRIADDPAERLLAEAMVNVCREIKRRVLVTRVETPQQAAMWRKLGADYFQGYAIAKPTPVMFMAP